MGGFAIDPANPPKSEDKYVKKVFNWSEVHFSEMTCYKIYTLVVQYLWNKRTGVEKYYFFIIWFQDFSDINQDDPNAVVVGLAPEKFNHQYLTKAFCLIKEKKAPLIAIHKGWGNLRRYFQSGPMLKNESNHWPQTYNPKGQTISKAIYGVLNSPKNEHWDNFM